MSFPRDADIVAMLSEFFIDRLDSRIVVGHIVEYHVSEFAGNLIFLQDIDEGIRDIW